VKEYKKSIVSLVAKQLPFLTTLSSLTEISHRIETVVSMTEPNIARSLAPAPPGFQRKPNGEPTRQRKNISTACSACKARKWKVRKCIGHFVDFANAVLLNSVVEQSRVKTAFEVIPSVLLTRRVTIVVDSRSNASLKSSLKTRTCWFIWWRHFVTVPMSISLEC
jgi:hypothetical protein